MFSITTLPRARQHMAEIGLISITLLTCTGCKDFHRALKIAAPGMIRDTWREIIHHHGPGCGHVRVNGVWVVAHGHLCTSSCHGHYWNGTHNVYVEKHRHGHGCGHHWDGHHWVDAHISGHVEMNININGNITTNLEGHTCSSSCDGHYWNDGKYVVVVGHQHGRACGHHWDGHHWVLSATKD